MQASGSGGLTVTGNTLSGSGTNGFNNLSGMSAVVTATDNFWGDPSGPFDPSVADGISNPRSQRSSLPVVRTTFKEPYFETISRGGIDPVFRTP